MCGIGLVGQLERLQPEAQALERVGRQGDAPPLFAGEELRGIDFDAGKPEPGQRAQQERPIGLLVLRVAQRVRHRLAGDPGRMLTGQSRQCLARPDLQ